MCIGERDSAAFIRRKDAALAYLWRLLQDQELSDEEAIQATTDKFALNASVRDDYRIYKALWNLTGD